MRQREKSTPGALSALATTTVPPFSRVRTSRSFFYLPARRAPRTQQRERGGRDYSAAPLLQLSQWSKNNPKETLNVHTRSCSSRALLASLSGIHKTKENKNRTDSSLSATKNRHREQCSSESPTVFTVCCSSRRCSSIAPHTSIHSWSAQKLSSNDTPTSEEEASRFFLAKETPNRVLREEAAKN